MNNKKLNNKSRCIYSNKIIGNKEAVLKEHIKDYLEKEGYKIIHTNEGIAIIKLREWLIYNRA